MARAQTGESQVFDRLDFLPTRFFPPQSQIVLISSLARDDLAMLVRLRARGFQLLVVRPDPIAFEESALELQPAMQLAARFARAERVLLCRKLQQVGIQVVDWEVSKPFDRVIHASLKQAPHWFRAVGGQW